MSTNETSWKVPFERGPEAKDIVLLGSGRSGTTWIFELLLCLPGYRGVFEPMHPSHYEMMPFLTKAAFRYLKADGVAPELEKHWLRLLNGELDLEWRSYAEIYNRRPRPYQTVIKSIRMNLAGSWLQRFDCKIVFVERAPLRVVSSSRQVQWRCRANLETLLSDKRLVAEHLTPYHSTLEQISQDGNFSERLTAFWWVENYVAKQILGEKAYFLSYESLLDNRERELEKLCAFLEQPMPAFLVKRSHQASNSKISGIQEPTEEDEKAVKAVLERLEASR